MNTPLINFDIIYHYKQDKAIDIIMKDIMSKKSQSSFSTIVGFMLLEVTSPSDIENCRDTLLIIKNNCSKLGIDKIYIIANYPYDQYEEHFKEFEIIYFEAFSHCVYNSYELHPEKLSSKWNADAEGFLFLNAIPARINRIRLLSKFWKLGLLKHSKWSLFKPYSHIIERDCRRLTHDLSDSEYKEFMKIAVRRIDDVPSINFTLASLTCPLDWCIDRRNYEETKLSIISETCFRDSEPLNDLSEKTWRAIINQHPFIIAGTVGIRRRLESLGFKTFIEYFAEDYDNYSDYEERLDSIVKNTLFFLENSNKYRDEIKKDTEYNLIQFNNLIKKNKSVINYLHNTVGVSQQDLDSIFKLPNYIPLTSIEDMKALDAIEVEQDAIANKLA